MFPTTVPYNTTISPPLANGSQIHISGTPYGKRFEVNLKSYQDDFILHVNPRFDDNALVLNTAKQGAWAEEQRHPLTIYNGVRFTMVIMATDQNFRISINNNHVCNFVFRNPLYLAQLLEVKGELNLESVQIYPGSSPGYSFPMPMGINITPGFVQMPPMPAVNFNPGFGFPSAPSITINTNPMMNSPMSSIQPCHLNIGSRIFVRGYLPMNPNRFEFNFLQGYSDTDDIAFHFNPRFDTRTIVKNHRSRGVWGQEENQPFPPYVPLVPGAAVDLQVACLADRYTIFMNNILVAEYYHKIPPGYVTAIQCKGDVQITSIDQM